MDGVTVPEDQAETLKIRAECCLANLIHHLAATTETDALCHIDISASRSSLKFRTVAAPLSDAWVTSSAASDRISIAHDPESRHLTVTLAHTKNPNRMTPKMPVDEGISSRLENLLETPVTEDPNPFQQGVVL